MSRIQATPDIGADENDDVPPQPPQSFVQLSSQARRVVDSDEETFLLYTLTPPPAGRLGLGSIDSGHDTLRVTFDLDGTDEPQMTSGEDGTARVTGNTAAKSGKALKSRTKKAAVVQSKERHALDDQVSVLIHQNSTSLRSTSGDTGSVIWRSSSKLAACLIRQMHRWRRADECSLLNLTATSSLNVLELGAGTGVLPALLLSYLSRLSHVLRIHWTATDQANLIPLLNRNLAGIPLSSTMTVSARELDWIACSREWHSGASYGGGLDGLRKNVLDEAPSSTLVDLLIAVDCVFNPSLFSPLMDTIDTFTTPNHTIVLVVMELRSSDATMQFLESWLHRPQGDRWRIWTVPGDQLTCGLDQGYAAWVAWKE